MVPRAAATLIVCRAFQFSTATWCVDVVLGRAVYSERSRALSSDGKKRSQVYAAEACNPGRASERHFHPECVRAT